MPDIAYRPLGPSGLLVSTIGLGCNNFGRPKTLTETQEGTDAVIHAAIDAGVTLLDTADIYGGRRGLSETLMGKSLKGRRDEVVLATKFGLDMAGENGPDWGARASRRYIRIAIENSLTRLQTDYIDLYQLHRPDGITPIDETLSTLDDLIRAGKIRYLGHSNLAGWQIAEAEYVARMLGTERFISAQDEYSLLARGVEQEVLPAVRAYGLGFLPYFPLFNGVFTGKFNREGGPANSRIMHTRPQVLDTVPWDAYDRFAAFCAERDISILEATFGWLLDQPNLSSVIAGATTPDQIRQNAAASVSWTPTVEEVETIGEFFPV